ncbi:8-amino-7-oxononanoate synthase [Psychrobacter frigidicola]|uniref:8-amino-7-oxononanoate synthase n=1 Tax=Psychrobacter frigidicola TaxID=45611 RepID=A0A5C7A039_9GAMM|nr:8-amino-7-oxononanoate synthase [Psychrobacter frigidicola]TXD96744.1 8-amino-7-oxononanoate synthase [Psychrobacter frigidicola]
MTSPIATAITTRLQEALESLKSRQQYRHLPNLDHQGRYVISQGKSLLNIASNDYLGLSADNELRAVFFNQLQQLPAAQLPKMSATSSRLLTGNDHQLQALESELQQWYQAANLQDSSAPKSALVINSGYHANIGILPALTALPAKTIILADKLVHASIIDGMHLSQSKLCTYRRYRHNDYMQLALMIEQAEPDVERIIIVTESIFSMDGDRADLPRLVQLKATDSRIELYVDEAHAVGVLGEQGLGLAEETKTLADIDYLVGTFGKAFASVGAYILCHDSVKQWLINHMRPLIFSTALPPTNHAWTRFILAKMPQLNDKRAHLAALSLQLSQAISQPYRPSSSTQQERYQSPIIPYILGDNASTVAKAKQLQDAGFYALPIRPPTVPANTARIRLVMNAALTHDDCQRLIENL